jgi:hypothetical protein
VVCPPLTGVHFNEWLDRRQPEEFALLSDATAPPPEDDLAGYVQGGNGGGNGPGGDDSGTLGGMAADFPRN